MLLSAAQRCTGRELGSVSAVADSKQTLLCTYLSAVLLAGLSMNIVLQEGHMAVRRADTDRAGDGRGQRWTGQCREGWPPAC